MQNEIEIIMSHDRTVKSWISSIATGIAIAIIIIAIVVFSATLIHALWYAPEDEVPLTEAQKQVQVMPSAPARELPARLLIPSLGIDALVQHVGITAKGNMAAPHNFTDVGWYKYGTVPGQVGSAVIDGHVDNGLALDGVFKHLNELKIGDRIQIVTASSTSLTFKVVDIQSYSIKDVPTEKLFMQADTSRLNLITCEGTWVQKDKTYDHRLVIYTTLVSS